MKFSNYITDIKEDYNPTYEAQMVEIFNKAVRDELEASINYKVMAEQISGAGVNLIKSQLIEHSNEEFAHFNQFIAYAADHSFLDSVRFEIRTDLVNPVSLPKEVQGIVQFTQDLEKNAFEDYKAAARLATSEGDNETRMFFEELMADEMKHFDAVSDLDNTGRARRLNDI